MLGMNKENSSSKNTKGLASAAWDLFCIASVIGIWPRFIEPRLLSTTCLTLSIPALPNALKGLKILQFSDLHWNSQMSPTYLSKLIQKVDELSPDIIVFTGDALCYGSLCDPEPLQDFLSLFEARYGCYAVLGNHDYQEYISVNSEGDYDIGSQTKSPITKGWKRFFTNIKLTGKMNPQLHSVPFQSQLLECYKNSPFELLHNESRFIKIKDSGLNICGLGEHMLGRCLPEEAFKNYDKNYPGIILLHNPDGLQKLVNCPGELILCGHTHGGQVNLPGFCHKFMYLENPSFKRGLIKAHHKTIYVNRGIGSVMPFRWFSTPELLLITLKEKQP